MGMPNVVRGEYSDFYIYHLVMYMSENAKLHLDVSNTIYFTVSIVTT